MRRSFKILIATSVLLLALVGCGDGGGDTSASNAGTAPASTHASTGSEQASPSSPGQGKTGSVPKPAAPSGGGSHHDSATGPASFEVKGGDNSIQQSGSEAASSELAQAAAALHGYLDARAAGEWRKACTFVTLGLIGSMRQLARGKGGNLSCPKLVALLSAGLPPAAMREATVVDVGALRVKGESAFLLFHGAHGVDYFIPMGREGDEWKVAAIAPSALQ